MISITRIDSRQRGEVKRSLELGDNVRFPDMLGALESLLRQCYADDMRNKTLNLSRDTSMPVESNTRYSGGAINSALHEIYSTSSRVPRVENAEVNEAYDFAEEGPTPAENMITRSPPPSTIRG